MGQYPEAVAMIVSDYIERVKRRLGSIPAPEREEFLREVQSQVLEAYAQEPGTDEIARILAVLRRLGEPGEVVSDRLPAAMARRKLPLSLIAAVLIALFGIPLGFGGAAVVAGVLAAFSGLVIGYYVMSGLAALAGMMLVMLGLVRAYQPEFWDRLIAAGVIRIDPDFAQLIEPLSAQTQGLSMIIVGLLFAAAGVGLLWLGRYVVRGYRFLGGLVFEHVRKLGRAVRKKVPALDGVRPFKQPETVSFP